ncbi:MAG: molecular chaperone DnaJ [Planctomycetes bacterium]|nr:molecular chaperone DnaJ [Planctomycetota bacterium]
MAEKADYYEVLGVAKTASEREIANAYRKLAIKYHPDSNPGDAAATDKFKQAAEAYEVLSDPAKRARYDQFGHAGVNGATQFGSVEDIFDAFGDIFSGTVFGDFFGGGRGGRAHKGQDLRCRVTLDLEEAARGVTKTVEFQRSRPCKECKGSGAAPGSSRETCRRCGGHGQVVQSAGILRVQTTCPTCRGSGSVIARPCRRCSGSGYEAGKVSLDVPIPAGVDDGTRVRITGQGEPSPDGGPPGDCYCFVTVRRHNLFHREGQDLILELPISYSQAALGATIEVPTLDGPDELTIPAGTQPGDVFRIRRRGMPNPHGGPRGDLLVQTLVEVPKTLNPRQEVLLRELAELENTHVTPQRKGFLERLRDYFHARDDATGNVEDKEHS